MGNSIIYENEVGFRPLTKQDLPPGLLEQFANSRIDYEYVSLLQWEEHCTECAMPACYKSCDYYMPRKDGKCRRFKNGFELYKPEDAAVPTIARIEFKKWGALMSIGSVGLVDKGIAGQVKRRLDMVAKIARVIPDKRINILGRHGVSSRLATRYKKYIIRNTISSHAIDVEPDYFVIQLFNPTDKEADITFMIRAIGVSKGRFPYQKRLIAAKGHFQLCIPFDEIRPFLDLRDDHYVSITPNNAGSSGEPLCLFFGQIGFVKSKSELSEVSIKMVKVVAWDLDNTLWEGTLTETEGGAVVLKKNVKRVMETLDRRGIVNSVVSKNDYDIAMAKLKEFDLDDLIVFPKINWLPKSQAISELAKDINIGIDTIAFVDDSEFERSEVSQTLPKVRVYDPLECDSLLEKREFKPEVSSESSGRRKFYQSQQVRQSEQNHFSGNYLEFVRSCEMQVTINFIDSENIDRANELVQRTNQLNFSGNRYDQENLLNFISNETIDAFSIECKDKFGDYGTVGLCMVDLDELNMIDLMFSCRVQSKRVEHAFLHWLLQHYKLLGYIEFSATYNKTEKNTPSGTVFKDMNFRQVAVKDSKITYTYNLENQIENEGVVKVIDTL